MEHCRITLSGKHVRITVYADYGAQTYCGACGMLLEPRTIQIPDHPGIEVRTD